MHILQFMASALGKDMKVLKALYPYVVHLFYINIIKKPTKHFESNISFKISVGFQLNMRKIYLSELPYLILKAQHDT